MGFGIHAAGSGNYRYTRRNCGIEDLYDASSAVSMLESLPDGAAAVAAEVVSNQALPDSPQEQGVQAIYGMNAWQALRIGVYALAAERNPTVVGIRVGTDNMVSPDTAHFVEARIRNHARPAARFVEEITPALEAEGLNSNGVLLRLGGVFSQFSAHHPRQAPHRLLIFLSH